LTHLCLLHPAVRHPYPIISWEKIIGMFPQAFFAASIFYSAFCEKQTIIAGDSSALSLNHKR
jgi:hypothetical protein